MNLNASDAHAQRDPLSLPASALLPVVVSLVCHSIRIPLPDMARAADLRLGGDTLAADSIDVITAATAVSEMFRLGELQVDDYLLRDTRMGAWAELASHALTLSGGQLCFRSSGSSGKPSSHIHDLGRLNEEAMFFSRKLDGNRVVTATPPHHIYGFIWGPLLAEALGVECVVMAHSGTSAWSQGAIRADDIVIGFPLFWSWFARTRGSRETRLAGVCSTAPLPDRLASDVIGTGVQPFLEIFGSSETAGLGWRDDSREAFRLLPHWRCSEDRKTLKRCTPEGSARYRVPVPDHLQWDSDARAFRPLGRIDGALQIGGTNVFPDAIADRMKAEVAGVADSVLRSNADHASHARLKAFVVPDADASDLETLEHSLHAWARKHLRPAERPVSVTFGARLPRNAMGKLTDW